MRKNGENHFTLSVSNSNGRVSFSYVLIGVFVFFALFFLFDRTQAPSFHEPFNLKNTSASRSDQSPEIEFKGSRQGRGTEKSLALNADTPRGQNPLPPGSAADEDAHAKLALQLEALFKKHDFEKREDPVLLMNTLNNPLREELIQKAQAHPQAFEAYYDGLLKRTLGSGESSPDWVKFNKSLLVGEVFVEASENPAPLLGALFANFGSESLPSSVATPRGDSLPAAVLPSLLLGQVRDQWDQRSGEKKWAPLKGSLVEALKASKDLQWTDQVADFLISTGEATEEQVQGWSRKNR